MRTLSRLSVRARLTLWYASTLTVVLAGFALGTLVLVRNSEFREIDRQLESDYGVAEEIVESAVRAGTLAPVHQTLVAEPGSRWRWLEIWDTTGRLLYTIPEDATIAVPKVSGAPALGSFGPASVPLDVGGHARVLSRPMTFLGRTAVIRVLRSEEGLADELNNLMLELLALLSIGVALAGVGGYAMAQRVLMPVAQMAERVRTIKAERLAERLEIQNPDDEFGQLAGVFNDTLTRIESSFEQLRRFTADVSHELRTPLTAIRSVGEIGLREHRSEAEYREVVGSLLEETDRLSRLIDSLLTVSRGDSQLVTLSPEVFDVSVLVRDVVDCLGVLAEEKHQPVTIDAPAPVIVKADPGVLRQAVMNILDNAIKYSAAGCGINLRVAQTRSDAIIEIQDHGIGIASEHLDKIFDRFYRADKARHTAGGAGLGLAIARWAVEANGGSIEVKSELRRGSTFRIIVPRVAGAQPGSETGHRHTAASAT